MRLYILAHAHAYSRTYIHAHSHTCTLILASSYAAALRATFSLQGYRRQSCESRSRKRSKILTRTAAGTASQSSTFVTFVFALQSLHCNECSNLFARTLVR
jgi:hypothetical protein